MWRSKSKFKNIKVGKYDSKKENKRAMELRLLERAGVIKDLREQVKFELIPAQYMESNGKRRCVERACNYYADFTYFDTRESRYVVEDAKGFRTEVYKIKKKLMLHRHGVRIKET